MRDSAFPGVAMFGALIAIAVLYTWWMLTAPCDQILRYSMTLKDVPVRCVSTQNIIGIKQ